MKRLLISTASSIPLALASLAYAQTTPPPRNEKPAAETPATTPGGMPATTPGATPGAAAGTTPAPMTAPNTTSNAKESVRGWSVKDKIMGKSVYNDNDEKIGDVTDVVLTSDGQVPYFVVGAGGFLGMGQHDVAISFDKFKRGDDRLTLSGYTKDQLKALPQVELDK